MNYLDDYCERAGDPSFWAEPLNAITNLAFLIAAIMIGNQLRGTSIKATPDIYLLSVVLACIGIGSGLWHFYATKATMIMDVIPIILFINIYLIAFLYRAFKLSWWKVLAFWVGFQLLNIQTNNAVDPSVLHGTIMYLPTYAVLLTIMIFAFVQKKWFARTLGIMVLLWTASLIFRTIDIPLCAFLSSGTHFLWHLLNAIVLYGLLALLIKISKHHA